jgi:transcriptional repressor NrdR
VTDSRASQDGYSIRRRRECLACRRRYTTYERIEEPAIKVVKKDGGRVPFERQKIKKGLQKACWKRPVSDEQIEAILAAVEGEMHANFDTEVESGYLGELVMQHRARWWRTYASPACTASSMMFTTCRVKPMLEKPRRPG